MLEQEIQELLQGSYYDGNGANNHKLWLQMYRGEYFYLDSETCSLNLACTIASELARMATIEMKSELSDEELDKDYQKVIDNARKFTEYAMALGGIILKPYPADERIAVDYVTPNMFVPLGFDSFGNIIHIAFLDKIVKKEEGILNNKNVYYTRLEEHELKDNIYRVTNLAYKSNNPTSLGDEVPLDTIDEWKDLEKEVHIKDVQKPLFGYFKNPQANNLDLKSPLGASCYARATSLIQDADEQYSRILWEYKGSELAIDADITVLKKSGELPVGKERLFRNLGIDQKDGFYEVFSPEIRDSALFHGLNQILRRIEYVCGLAYGTISDVGEQDKTATEVKASKQRSYATVVDIQKSLQLALEDLVYAMNVWKTLGKSVKKEDYEISFEFDDSLIVDAQSEQAILLQEVSAGLIKPEMYLMRRYGVTEEQAKEILPNMNKDINEKDYDDFE